MFSDSISKTHDFRTVNLVPLRQIKWISEVQRGSCGYNKIIMMILITITIIIIVIKMITLLIITIIIIIIIIIIITVIIINIYIAQIACEHDQKRVTNKYDTN